MRRIVTMMVIIGLIAALPSLLCASDASDTYMKLMDDYYFLDKQEVNRVTCHVVLSTLNSASLRDQLKQFGDKIALQENLNDFKVVYSKKDGVSFVTPHVSVSLVSNEGVKDPKQVQKGIEMINNGVKMQIDGATQIIKGTLDDLVSPQISTMADLDVSNKEGSTTVKYSKENVSHLEVYSGDTKKTSAKAQGSEIEETQVFSRLNGKLAPFKDVIQLRQGDTLLDTTTAIQYQNLGKLFFPSVLDQQIQVKGPNLKQEGQINISIKDCQAE